MGWLECLKFLEQTVGRIVIKPTKNRKTHEINNPN